MTRIFITKAALGAVLAFGVLSAAQPARAQSADTADASTMAPAAEDMSGIPFGPSSKTHLYPADRPGLFTGGVRDWLSGVSNSLDKEYDDYLAFKKRIKDDYHLDFSMDTSFYWQTATPHGGAPVYLLVYYPSLTWQPFTDTSFGSGEINVTWGRQNYLTGRNSVSQAGNLGIINLANDWTTDNWSWSTVSYTHTLPGDMKWLSIGIGQYNLFSFDPSAYAGNAQTTFIGYSFAQDATQTFPNAGLGGWLQAKSDDGQFTLAGGLQGATNLSGRAISTRGFEEGKLLYFGNIQWAPKVSGLGDGLYSFMMYEQPGLPNVTNRSVGVSLSLSQAFGDDWGGFIRVNNATGHDIPVETSANIGAVRNDPFNRSPSDQLGLAFGWNKNDFIFNGVTGANSRKDEYVTELYYNYTFFKGLILTPDVQVYFDPALAPNTGTAAVFTLRATIFF